MKHIKRLLCIAITLALLLGMLSGCRTGQAEKMETTQSTQEAQTAPVTTEAPTEPSAEAPETAPALPEPAVIAREDVAPTGPLADCPLYIRAVDGLPEDFILGMDASQVPALEASGVKYYDFDGEEADVFRILAENGVNYIRVRVWNDPFDAEGNGYGGGNCTVDTALEIGVRATRYGMKLLVDFHYSDFWADPGKQMVPKAWQGLSLDEKAAALGDYTRESLLRLYLAGVDVGMVQVGNETNGALCGEKEWSAICRLMQAGAAAVREIYPGALVAVHFANPESGAYPAYAENLARYDLDYDVFGSSYYPYWHGSLDNLTNTLARIREDYGKQVMVLETSYAWTVEDSDFSGNTISAQSAVDKPFPYSLQGQVNSLRSVVQAVQDAGGIGVCYWEGTWIGVGGASQSENRALWEQYGSGWASSYAAEYDPDDAGKWYGGCAVDNQAFFDAEGRALESLKAFNLIRWGNETELAAEELIPVELDATVGDALDLPASVQAVMTDGSTQELPVVWDKSEDEFDALLLNAGTDVTLSGTAGGLPARLHLTVRGVNLLANPGFEDGADAPWEAENLGGSYELRIEKKAGDSRSGEWHYHFWSKDPNAVAFTLEQSRDDLQTGTYSFSIQIMGGDCGEAEVYAYVLIDGEQLRTAPMQITSWNEWHEGRVDNIAYAAGQKLTVGIFVKTDAAGAWGKIDDAELARTG